MDVNKRNIFIIVTIMILIVITIIGYIGYNQALIKLHPKVHNNDNNNSDDETENKDEYDENEKVCVGRYYGEYQKYLDDGNITLDLKYTYILNGNNTYSANFVSSGNEGTYSIVGNKIIFKHAPETTGPGENNEVEDEYEIADDCSYIIIDEPETDIYSFKLYRQ